MMNMKNMKLIKEKVYSNARISADDALYLFESNDIIAIGEMAARRLRHSAPAPEEVYYSYNININPTNICGHRCRLCAFSKDAGGEGAYEETAGEIIRRVEAAVKSSEDGHIEAHIVGGLSPKYDLAFYEGLLRSIKALSNKITIQAFTAVEIDYLSSLAGISVTKVLERLKAAGLDALPGGGAEIFNDKIRSVICEKKIKTSAWLDVMKRAHQLGIPTNATMLYGHIETDRDRARHLELLRNLQDETGGFKSFVPLSFYGDNVDIKRTRYNSGFDDLKVIAVARIFLDNFISIKALHNMLGLKFAQAALYFGANDLGGTSFDERIAKAAGAYSPAIVRESGLIKIIEGAGKKAVKTDSAYLLKIRRN
jgi:aminodeoxyfutalosine synthase